MTRLPGDWLTDGNFDFEYKKYVLLAYLQNIDRQFSANRLYPHLPDLQSHLNSCAEIQANKESLRAFFPKNLTGIDTKNWNLVYEDTYKETAYLSDLNYIIDFAIPNFTKMLGEGSERFSKVTENVKISPVGIVPLRVEEGYLFFVHALERMISIYQYQLALYNEMKERYLKTVFVESVRLGIGNTIAQIKVDLTKRNRSLPNPATYVVESKYEYPLDETLLPVVKKLMLTEINLA